MQPADELLNADVLAGTGDIVCNLLELVAQCGDECAVRREDVADGRSHRCSENAVFDCGNAAFICGKLAKGLRDFDGIESLSPLSRVTIVYFINNFEGGCS